MLALIDGDIITFRAAASAEGEEEAWVPTSRANIMIEEILHDVGATSYEIWLSGDNNFRYTVYPEYKANRIRASRPKWENEVKDYLVRVWDAQRSSGCEADDMLGVRQTVDPSNSIICTIDKDLWQIPGFKWNFVKKEKSDVTYLEGMRFFYYQMLVGDTTDGIKGVPGIGPKKAERILLQGETVEEWHELVRDAYNNDDFMEMSGKCLWIWRKMNDIWRLPIETSISESEGQEIAATSP